MKKFICIILALLLMTPCIISASAADRDIADTGKTLVTYGDWVYELIGGDKYWEIDSYIGNGTDLVIPRLVNDVMVVSLSDYCFNGNATLKSVKTSSPLWSIGEYAFYGCTNLESIELNFALKSIGVGAFVGTNSLKSINLEDSVVTEIKPHTFTNSGIEEVTLPGTCTEIMHDAFSQCADLTKIVIPRSVTTIDDTAFSNCENLTIYCYTDSAAHQFAVAKDIPFVLIDAPAEVTFILGDADGDGFITVVDATKIQRVLVELDEDPDGMIALRAADGQELNITHATAIQRYLADYSVTMPIGTKVTRTVPV